MQIFSEDEAGRALGLVATIIDGYEGNQVAPALEFLLTDVEDWEALSMELAGHAACVLITLAGVLSLDPYALFERYANNET